MKMRVIRCPQCGHEGAIPRYISTDRKVKCRTCGTVALIRQATGPKPCSFRSKPSAADLKSAAAQDVLSRYAPIPDGGDRLDDLFGGGL